MKLGHAGTPVNKIADKKGKETSRRQERMLASPYQDLFLKIIDVIHEKWNTEWNENDGYSMKANQMLGHGKKIIGVERRKLLPTGSERAIHY